MSSSLRTAGSGLTCLQGVYGDPRGKCASDMRKRSRKEVAPRHAHSESRVLYDGLRVCVREASCAARCAGRKKRNRQSSVKSKRLGSRFQENDVVMSLEILEETIYTAANRKCYRTREIVFIPARERGRRLKLVKQTWMEDGNKMEGRPIGSLISSR